MTTSYPRQPDFDQFLAVLRRDRRPKHLPFYEHLASPGFIARRTATEFDRWNTSHPEYWKTYVDFWLGMGFDCVPMEIAPKLPLGSGSKNTLHIEGSESMVVITNREDFETYPWPDESSYIEFEHFETVSKLLPDGAKIVGGVAAGPYEWVSWMLGTIGISYLLADDPELVGTVFERIGKLHVSALRQLATVDAIGALRQGDDLGFKTATFLRPDDLRKYVFPIYKQMTDVAHGAGKPFILHSCGQLEAVYDDLIEDCRIDAKHSFEDQIMPVAEFKRKYGSRITPLGGLDVDVICRSTEQEVRRYARQAISECFADGFWALGTGNSLTDYMPVDNYLAVLDEGMRIV
jgi:uroporphyrinogen decarboxylase